jgi:hypothetical protein
VIVGGRQPDVEVRPERDRHLVLEEGAEALARDPPDDLADQVSLGHGVVARGGTRLPPRCLRGQQARHLLPVTEVLVGDRRLPPGQAGRVRHEVADLDGLLARRRELGPVVGDGGVEVELAAVGQDQRAQGRHGLGRRPHVGDGVALPRGAVFRVDPAAPEVDDRLALQVDGHGGADIVPCVDVGGEQFFHPAEAVVTGPMHLGHRELPSSGGPAVGRPWASRGT